MTTTTKLHPVYLKATQRDYIDTADQAKLIRSTLAARFPGIKFYVRCERFAGGSAIDIYYDGRIGWESLDGCHCYPSSKRVVKPDQPNYCQTCGFMGRLTPVYRDGAPSKKDVEAVTNPYRGGAFDGMIDMAYDVTTWLLPDGTATWGRSPGTGDQRGSDPGYSEPRPEPGAVLVRFGANYVSAHDELPYDIKHAR